MGLSGQRLSFSAFQPRAMLNLHLLCKCNKSPSATLAEPRADAEAIRDEHRGPQTSNSALTQFSKLQRTETNPHVLYRLDPDAFQLPKLSQIGDTIVQIAKTVHNGFGLFRPDSL